MTIRTRLVFIDQNNESDSFFVHTLVLKIGKRCVKLDFKGCERDSTGVLIFPSIEIKN